METVEEFKKFISDSVEINKNSHAAVSQVARALNKMDVSKGRLNSSMGNKKKVVTAENGAE